MSFEIESAQKPKTLQKALVKMHRLPKGKVLETLLLRAMKQARYSAENLGHYGLASDAYLHFTSPIRRYPDVMVHRALKKLEGSLDRAKSSRPMTQIADQSSDTERRAMVVEREVVDLHRAILMQKHHWRYFRGHGRRAFRAAACTSRSKNRS